MIGPRTLYLFASAVLATGVGVAFMDRNAVPNNTGVHAKAAPPPAEQPVVQAAPAPRSAAIPVATAPVADSPVPDRQADVSGLAGRVSVVSERAGPLPSETPPKIPATLSGGTPPASAEAKSEPKPAR